MSQGSPLPNRRAIGCNAEYTTSAVGRTTANRKRWADAVRGVRSAAAAVVRPALKLKRELAVLVHGALRSHGHVATNRVASRQVAGGAPVLRAGGPRDRQGGGFAAEWGGGGVLIEVLWRFYPE